MDVLVLEEEGFQTDPNLWTKRKPLGLRTTGGCWLFKA